ncbi:ABC transporter permease [Moorella naiadis]|uniref:ABC transporter permease n=1 Tax=Moorella naiadis (nom. illeg.) TaxID=3093670 RepID=UPI003D9CA3F6
MIAKVSPRSAVSRALPFISLIIIIIAWQAIASGGYFGKSLPAPTAVMSQFLTMLAKPIGKTSLYGHVWASMRRVLTAYIIAVIIGVPLGLFMGWNKKVDAIVKPIFEIFRPIPPIAWIPLAILWFGIDETPKVFICFIGAFVPAVMNAYTGIRFTEPLLLNAARTLGANQRQLFTEVAIPSALPAIFAGLQNGLSLSWMCVLAAEMVGAQEGVGYLILLGMDMSNPAMIITGMLIIGAVGALIALALRYVERWVCPWKREISI